MTQAAILAASGSPGTTTGFKNRIINGAMVIDQRNAGASVSTTSQPSYSVDRFPAFYAQTSKFTMQQNAGSVTPPAGFTNYLGITSTSSYSSVSTDYFGILQRIEGYNVADLGFGTANAKTVTLSFQVYSSLTGTFSGSLLNSAENRCYPFSYTVSSANTWTPIAITIAGDTTGTWLTTNGIGMEVAFDLGSGSTKRGTGGSWQAAGYLGTTGSVSIVGTSGATFYITGVQLEVGTTATNFDYRSYGTELALCQRYYFQLNGTANSQSLFAAPISLTDTYRRMFIVYPVTTRAAPTFTLTGSTNGTFTGTKPAVDTTPTTTTVGLNLDLTGAGYAWLTSLTASAEL